LTLVSYKIIKDYSSSLNFLLSILSGKLSLASKSSNYSNIIFPASYSVGFFGELFLKSLFFLESFLCKSESL